MEDTAQRFACIDVGTNTVKLVVADLTEDSAKRVFEQGVTSRLGEGMQAYGMRLKEAPMRRTLDAIAEFVAIAQAHGVQGLAAVGTAALRDAHNRDAFLQRVQERCGLQIEVIAGEEEARLSYLAVRQDPRWREFPRLIVIDIGGGSTELIQGEAGTDQIAARVSVNLGAVKITEAYLRSDPPTVQQLLAANQAAAEKLAIATLESADNYIMVGVGGTLTALGMMDCGDFVEAETLHGHALTADALEAQITLLAARTLQERQSIPGLPPERADIILGGAILLSQAMARIGATAVAVSTRGLRWGVLYDHFGTHKE